VATRPAVLGPAVPAPVRPQVRAFTPGPLRAGLGGTALSRLADSRNGLIAAADAFPLRPAGSGGSTPGVSSAPSIAVPRLDLGPSDLAEALPGLAGDTVAAAAKSPSLPIGIGLVVVLFLLVQNRIDRRDPKLAFAPTEDDEPLEFVPAASGGQRVAHLHLVAAA
jgi:hypothetical protein